MKYPSSEVLYRPDNCAPSLGGRHDASEAPPCCGTLLSVSPEALLAAADAPWPARPLAGAARRRCGAAGGKPPAPGAGFPGLAFLQGRSAGRGAAVGPAFLSSRRLPSAKGTSQPSRNSGRCPAVRGGRRKLGGGEGRCSGEGGGRARARWYSRNGSGRSVLTQG